MIKYVHEDTLLKRIDDCLWKGNRNGHHRGDIKEEYQAIYEAYNDFYHHYYEPMRARILSMAFDVENEASFVECADVLNEYWRRLKEFMHYNNIDSNSKIHTNFLEEFSIYFLASIYNPEYFDIFISDVFAGLKIKSSGQVEQITKDVDFCIGKEIENIAFPNQEPLTMRIPAISVEVKSYVDATMLGEIMNTSRKIKGANPGSKAILLTWINSFAVEHALEAAYDSSIDEIIVMSDKKRKQNQPIDIEFTAKGLRDYYEVMMKSMEQVLHEDGNIPTKGRLLAYVRHLNV